MAVKPQSAAAALREVAAIVDQRGKSYGSSRENFGRIAELWTSYKGTKFSREDVAILFILAKVARLVETPGHKDSLLDIAGYAALAIEAEQEEFDPADMVDKLRGRV